MSELDGATRPRTWTRRPGLRRRRTLDKGKLARWALSIGLFFVIWELIGQSGRLIAILSASEVLPDLAGQIAEGEILQATVGTLRIAAVGFAIGTVIGVPVGILIGVSEKWASVLDPLVNASLSAPIAMFIPVIAVYLGLEFKAKVVGVLLFNVFVIIVNTATGIREVPPSVVEMGRAFGTGRGAMYRRIILPWASPYIITGLRIGVGRSVEGAILFDLFLRTENLGLVIRNAAGSFDLSTLLGSVFFITIIAAGTMGLARIVEWRLLRWKTG
jgi:ABC-type nitrate/sulfonate/bicarbonate transport system permease component